MRIFMNGLHFIKYSNVEKGDPLKYQRVSFLFWTNIQSSLYKIINADIVTNIEITVRKFHNRDAETQQSTRRPHWNLYAVFKNDAKILLFANRQHSTQKSLSINDAV